MEQLVELFPNLSLHQLDLFNRVEKLYADWNAQINVISRKDIDQFKTRHLLHSLSIALFTEFRSGGKVLDVGTGGGFPGIPLAILFPEVHFTLVDSIGKKIKVVQAVANELQLTNVTAINGRAEQISGQFDYVVSRAVTRLLPFFGWVDSKIDFSRFSNSGFYGLKGGDLTEEIAEFQKNYRKKHIKLFNLNSKLKDDFFETKKLVFVG
ncbi:MAG: 16S rRNA (guanine(527)-N(7))-methyltransferase RsmG [Flavobacteriales bacterium]|nr:16S rRNA (guanine(527)-N(7))-methyltransferase RsmG [Flavobacteriales bacterium]